MAKAQYDLTDRELLNFVHNAQLALVDRATDADIPVIYSYQNQILETLAPSTLHKHTLATILVSAAWTLLEGGMNGNKKEG